MGNFFRQNCFSEPGFAEMTYIDAATIEMRIRMAL